MPAILDELDALEKRRGELLGQRRQRRDELERELTRLRQRLDSPAHASTPPREPNDAPHVAALHDRWCAAMRECEHFVPFAALPHGQRFLGSRDGEFVRNSPLEKQKKEEAQRLIAARNAAETEYQAAVVEESHRIAAEQREQRAANDADRQGIEAEIAALQRELATLLPKYL